MQKVIFVVLSIAVWGSSGQQEKSIINSKYFIPDFVENWFNATEYCNYLGMRLVIIDSSDVQSEVVEMVKKSDKFNEQWTTMWIGASDLAQESVFHWQATGRRVQYNNFRFGNPDNYNGYEHCVQLNYVPNENWHWTWNDRTCYGTNHFICENVEAGKINDNNNQMLNNPSVPDISIPAATLRNSKQRNLFDSIMRNQMVESKIFILFELRNPTDEY